jgi:Protein of unknown function (DUF2283)
MANGRIELKLSQDDSTVAYISLPDHPGSGTFGAVARQVRLLDLCGGYKGPDIYLDFDKENRLVGIEVLA